MCLCNEQWSCNEKLQILKPWFRSYGFANEEDIDFYILIVAYFAKYILPKAIEIVLSLLTSPLFYFCPQSCYSVQLSYRES